MSDDSEITCHIYSLPAEILLNIFIYLPAKDLTKCREVCVRWSLIIDGLARSDDLWSRYCKDDFSNVCAVARRKAKPGLLWYNLYRSLSLWQKIAVSRENSDEFSSASCMDEEIRNFELLGNGVLGVHKKASIVYYDIETLKESERGAITGDYSRYTENDSVIVILNYHLHCFLIRKALFDKYQEESNVTFDNVKLYALTDDALYYVNLDDEIYVCNFDDKKLRPVYLKQSGDGIMSVGYSKGHLNILTFQRDIYTIVGKDIVYKCSLGPDSNLLHQLKKFNFLEQLDWRVYFQWMYVLNHAIPDGPLRDIIIIRPYGDVYFVGSNWGVLRIYYAPYAAGEFNIFSTQPVKQYNFMERSDCPVLSMCPILQVDVFEVEDGHTVLVAMPKKIAVLNFTHTFKRTASLAMLPYSEIQRVKCLKISQIAETFNRTREVQENKEETRKKAADEHRRPAPSYLPGDRVMVAANVQSSAARYQTAKLAPRRDGPYIILRRHGPCSYEVAHPAQPTTPLGIYHTSALSPFQGSGNDVPNPERPLRRRGRPRKADSSL